MRQELRPGTVQEKMASGQNVPAERSCRLRTPGIEIPAADRVIVAPTQDADRARQRAAVGIDVCLVEREVSPEGREQELHQLVVIHDLGRGAAPSAQLIAKL